MLQNSVLLRGHCICYSCSHVFSYLHEAKKNGARVSYEMDQSEIAARSVDNAPLIWLLQGGLERPQGGLERQGALNGQPDCFDQHRVR